MLTFIVVVIIAATIYAGYRFTKSAPEAIEKIEKAASPIIKGVKEVVEKAEKAAPTATKPKSTKTKK